MTFDPREFIAHSDWRLVGALPESRYEQTVRNRENPARAKAIGVESFGRAAFEEFVHHIRTNGRASRIDGYECFVLELDGHAYWSTDCPVEGATVIRRRALAGGEEPSGPARLLL